MPPHPLRTRLRVLVPLAVALVGCAGELENPERFSAPSTSACPSDIDVVADIFAPKCGNAACHGAGETPAGALDLMSEGWAERMVNVASPDDQECAGYLRIDPADLDGSLLLSKLHEDTVPCGSRMPLLVEPVTEEETACIREWAQELVGSGAGGGGDAGGGGGDAGVADDAGAGEVDGGV